jgi:hypothetical protein
MKSNVCKIEKGTRDLAAILKESEKVAEYNGLSHKQTLQLRLLCEEIDGMLPNVIDDFEGKLWIDFEDGVCKINVSVCIPGFNTDKKNELIGIAKNKKNAAAVGIMGKIRNAIENFFLSEETMDSFALTDGAFELSSGYGDNLNYAYLWSLGEYRTYVNKEEQADAWDELEKSVIASVADDIIVGVKGNCAEVVIIKKFA